MAAKDPNRKSDPYVKVYGGGFSVGSAGISLKFLHSAVSLGQPRIKLGSTSKKKETLNPDWTKVLHGIFLELRLKR